MAGANVDRSGVQWLCLKVDTTSGALAYTTHGRVYDPAPTNPQHYCFPSLMVKCPGHQPMIFFKPARDRAVHSMGDLPSG